MVAAGGMLIAEVSYGPYGPPADHLNNIAFVILMAAILFCWAAFIVFIRKTIHAPLERRKRRLINMIKIMTFLGMWWYWGRNPETETDTIKKEHKKYKLFLHVRLNMAASIMVAILVFLMGFIYVKDFFLWFQVSSLVISPAVGLLALYFWLMYYLMKDVNYFDRSLLPDEDD